ncbi:hypothetical protein TNCV_823831 [Trichonephila clavipes]|nr:hypothetical protein TNCV_823831 [Trichonephila clavipes]
MIRLSVFPAKQHTSPCEVKSKSGSLVERKRMVGFKAQVPAQVQDLIETESRMRRGPHYGHGPEAAPNWSLHVSINNVWFMLRSELEAPVLSRDQWILHEEIINDGWSIFQLKAESSRTRRGDDGSSADLSSFRALGAENLQVPWHWRIEIYNQKIWLSPAYPGASGPLGAAPSAQWIDRYWEWINFQNPAPHRENPGRFSFRTWNLENLGHGEDEGLLNYSDEKNA